MPTFLTNLPGIIASFLGGLISPVVKLVKYLVLYKLVASHIRGKMAERYNDIRKRQIEIKARKRKSRRTLLDKLRDGSGF